MKNNLEIIARAVIINNDRILLCKQKDKSHYFLPGGHVESNETIKTALARELKEELAISINNPDFIGIVENIFHDDKGKHHEINLVFALEANGSASESMEEHLEFHWKQINSLENELVLPDSLKSAIVKWLGDRKKFWKDAV